MDLNAHQGVHNGIGLLGIQLGQLLRRQHLCGKKGVGAAAWPEVLTPPSWAFPRPSLSSGWCHPRRGDAGQGTAQASDLDGESRSGGPRTLRVKGCVGLPQTGGFQDVAALPVDEEAPGIEVHLVTRCLEVQGHCGHSRGGQGLLVALSSLLSLRGSLLSRQTDFVRRGLGSLQRGSPLPGWEYHPTMAWGHHGSQGPSPTITCTSWLESLKARERFPWLPQGAPSSPLAMLIVLQSPLSSVWA